MFPIALTIQGTGSYLPENKRLSTEIDRRLGWEVGQVQARFGLESRAVATPDETSSMMATEAARRAMDMADCGPEDLDLILGACGVMEQPIPSTAVLVQDRLGLGQSGIPAFDINATCLGFLQALDVAGLWVAAGRARRVLIFSADIASVGLNWSHPESAAIFGDGAGAVVVGAGEGAVLSHGFATYAEGKEACVLAAGGTRVNPVRGSGEGDDCFQMDGAQAYRLAARYLPDFLTDVLKRAGLERDELDAVLPHQASAQALRLMTRALHLPQSKVVDIFCNHGNQVAASIPTVLDYAVRNGRLQRGDKALLIGTSAGISIGGTVVQF